jgi:CheY-like chemotaxis protein
MDKTPERRPPARSDAPGPVPRPPQPPSAAGRVLLVEDNEVAAASTIALLTSFGWAVVHAVNAEVALEMLDSGQVAPDVVLTDIVMPGEFDGAQLAVHLRQTRPSLRIVLMTGQVTEVARASGDGFHLLPKPCAPLDLAEALGSPG